MPNVCVCAHFWSKFAQIWRQNFEFSCLSRPKLGHLAILKKKKKSLGPNFAIFAIFGSFLQLFWQLPFFLSIHLQTKFGNFNWIFKNWRQKWRNFEKKSKFSRIWAIFGPKWREMGKKLEKIGLKIVKNVCPNGLEFWAFWGYFFVIFFNFWPKYSLLGRLEWVRLKRVGKIEKKLSNLGQG